jgi:DNA-binding XRE family transcriptional regulator
MDARSSIAFGPELMRRRLAGGMTLTELAGRVNYSKSHLSKVENGKKQPSVALARTCDRELAAGGTLAALIQTPESGPDLDPDRGPVRGELWTVSMAGDGQTEFAAFDLGSPPGAGVGRWTSWTIGPPVGAAGAAELVPTFTRWLTEIRRLGQTAPSGIVGQILISAANIMRGLLAQPGGPEREATLRLASRMAEYTGWMAQENGDDAAALWWTAYAVRLAEACGDAELGVYALVRRAEIALYRGDPVSTVTLAKRAQQLRCGPRVRSFAAQREAQGHAYAGSESACRYALDRAADLAQAALGEADDPHVLGSSTMPDPLAFVTAWCLNDLGRAGEAADLLTTELGSLQPEARRTAALYSARRALSLAMAGELDEACASTRHALDRVVAIDSATVRHDLRHLNRAFGRWRTHDPVRRLLPDLTLALRVNIPEPIQYGS